MIGRNSLNERGGAAMRSGRAGRVNAVQLTIIVTCILALLLGIEYFVMARSNREQAYRTTRLLADQMENVLLTNEHKEQALVDSLKENYITKAKAVSYIIDHVPGMETDISEQIRVAKLMDIDEIHLFDETGTIYAGTVPIYYGYSFDSGEQMAYFKPMLENKALSMCQDVTPNTAEAQEVAAYLRQLYLDGEADQVTLVFQQYKSVLQQTPGCRQQDDTVSRHAFLAYHAGSRGQKPVPAPRM